MIPPPELEMPEAWRPTASWCARSANPPLDARGLLDRDGLAARRDPGRRRSRQRPLGRRRCRRRCPTAARSNGVRLLSEAGCEAIFREQADGDGPRPRGAAAPGHRLRPQRAEETPISPNPRACFWGGWGGSIVVNDLDARLTVAYVMNKMGEGTLGDLRGANVVMAAYAALAES